MKRFSDAVDHKMVPPDWIGCSGEHILRPEPVNSWCCRNIGGFSDWDRVGYDWWFRREQDAVLFRLRWG